MNNIYKAFANKQRLMLLQCLSKPKSVTELLTNCLLTQSALSQHLKVLREADLVTTDRKGKEIIYRVNNKKVTQITNLLLDFK